MKLILDKEATSFYTGSKPEVKPVFGWTDNVKDTAQSRDEATGLLVWTTELELIQGDYAEQGTKVKILAEKAPELSPRTEYKAEGIITATPWLPKGGTNVQVSIAVHGGFKSSTSRPALPVKHD
jgi:hypothetical protein